MRWKEHEIRMKSMRNEYKNLVAEHEWKGSFGRCVKKVG
jgi:hypothetical protein